MDPTTKPFGQENNHKSHGQMRVQSPRSKVRIKEEDIYHRWRSILFTPANQSHFFLFSLSPNRIKLNNSQWYSQEEPATRLPMEAHAAIRLSLQWSWSSTRQLQQWRNLKEAQVLNHSQMDRGGEVDGQR